LRDGRGEAERRRKPVPEIDLADGGGQKRQLVLGELLRDASKGVVVDVMLREQSDVLSPLECGCLAG
jgi:hypothetical protein